MMKVLQQHVKEPPSPAAGGRVAGKEGEGGRGSSRAHRIEGVMDSEVVKHKAHDGEGGGAMCARTQELRGEGLVVGGRGEGGGREGAGTGCGYDGAGLLMEGGRGKTVSKKSGKSVTPKKTLEDTTVIPPRGMLPDYVYQQSMYQTGGGGGRGGRGGERGSATTGDSLHTSGACRDGNANRTGSSKSESGADVAVTDASTPASSASAVAGL